MRDRGIAPIVGVTLLFGMVIVGAIGVFAVGSMAVDAVQKDAEIDSADASMSQIAASSDQLVSSETTNTEFEFSGGDGAATRLKPNAGHISVAVGNQTVLDRDLGVFEYENDDQRYAFQGGAVWRQGDGGNTVVSEQPPIRYATDNQGASTLDLDIRTISGDVDETGYVSGSINSQGSTVLTPEDYDPTEGEDRDVNVTVESQYCDGWQSHFESTQGATLEDTCQNDNTVSVRFSNDPSKWNVTRSTNPMYEYGVYADGNISIENAYGDFDTDLGASGDIDITEYSVVTGNQSENVNVERDSNDEMIQEKINGVSNPGTFCNSCEYDANDSPVYVDDMNGGGGSVTFDVSDGDINLIVDGDLSVSGSTNWSVKGYESGHSVNVYVADDIEFDGYVTMGPDDPNYPEAFQIYAGSDTFIDPGSSTQEFVGVISAPPGDSESGTTFADSFSIEMTGVLDVGDIEAENGAFEFTHVPIGEDDTPDRVDENVHENRTLVERGDRVHLHITQTELIFDEK